MLDEILFVDGQTVRNNLVKCRMADAGKGVADIPVGDNCAFAHGIGEPGRKFGLQDCTLSSLSFDKSTGVLIKFGRSIAPDHGMPALADVVEEVDQA
eukprot:5792210-Heterocapsa_arctica.AAC.2